MLLKKPPFKYLFDIIKGVMQKSAFGKDALEKIVLDNKIEYDRRRIR